MTTDWFALVLYIQGRNILCALPGFAVNEKGGSRVNTTSMNNKAREQVLYGGMFGIRCTFLRRGGACGENVTHRSG